MKKDQDREAAIHKLLGQLNELEQLYGRVPAQADPKYEPSGEVNARIKVLKRELDELGIRLEWDGSRYTIQRQEGCNESPNGS